MTFEKGGKVKKDLKEIGKCKADYRVNCKNIYRAYRNRIYKDINKWRRKQRI